MKDIEELRTMWESKFPKASISIMETNFEPRFMCSICFNGDSFMVSANGLELLIGKVEDQLRRCDEKEKSD